MKRDDFAELEDKKFILRIDGDNEVEIELMEVSEVRKTDKHEEFSLVFLAPAESALEPITYTLHHASLGELEIFLSPFWSDENGLKLEAAFSVTV